MNKLLQPAIITFLTLAMALGAGFGVYQYDQHKMKEQASTIHAQQVQLDGNRDEIIDQNGQITDLEQQVKTLNAQLASLQAPTQTGTLCKDGWVSPSVGSGTCSHHRGIAY